MKQKVIAKVLNTVGVILMLALIFMAVPFMIPRLLGYQLYGVLSESMTPAYSVGGVVYVREENPDNIEVGDVISFITKSNSDTVMTHRVVEKNEEEQYFITRGDANNTEDAEPVGFERLIGRVEFYIPHLSNLAGFINSTTGKSLLIVLFAVSVICWLVADMIVSAGPSRREQKTAPEGNRKRKPVGRTVFLLAGVALIAVSSVYLVRIMLGYHSSSREYDDLNELVMERETEDAEKDLTDEKVLSPEDRNILDEIQKLHRQYPEVIGWILFDDSKISYPITQGEDNFYYLKHTYSGTENSAGSIFMEAANEADFSDNHTIIYGHNMKNLSMFGSLRNYRKDGFYEEHQYFKIYTLDQVYVYQIFAYYDVDRNSDVYTIGFQPNQDFEKFIEKMLRRSYLDTGVSVGRDDMIVTLSTCSSKGKRFVVHAKRLTE